MEAGEGQLIFAQTFNRASDAFDDNGNLGVPVEFQKWELAAYGEYGLTSATTLYGRLAWQDVYQVVPAGRDEAVGFAATELGARRRLWRGENSVVSIQGAVFLPGQGENVNDLYFGQGGTDVEARVLAGRGFEWNGRTGFAEVQAGFRWRSENLPDEARLDLTAGLDVSEKVQLMGQLYLLQSIDAALPRRNYASVRVHLSAVYWRKPNSGYQLGAYKTVLGRNIIEENAIIFSRWIRF